MGGLRWEVSLGRRDSTTASLSAANSDLPAPFLDLGALISAYNKKNFTVEEMVALSGRWSMLLVSYIYILLIRRNF